jgi:hypothetical protein
MMDDGWWTRNGGWMMDGGLWMDDGWWTRNGGWMVDGGWMMDG